MVEGETIISLLFLDKFKQAKFGKRLGQNTFCTALLNSPKIIPVNILDTRVYTGAIHLSTNGQI